MCTAQAVATAMTMTIRTDRRPPRRSVRLRQRKGAGTQQPMTAHALLRLIWLASPALPVGGFSYSEGIEAAFESEKITDEAGALQWLLDQLHLSLARSDLAVVAKAFVAAQRGDAARLASLNAWVLLTRESSEFRLQTEQMGRSLVAWLQNQGLSEGPQQQLQGLQPCPTWPVVFALAAAQTGAPLREALLAFGFGWAENMVQAILKAARMGQNAGQRILAQLAQALPCAVDQAIRLSDNERQAFTPMLAILSAQHETQYSRLFRS